MKLATASFLFVLAASTQGCGEPERSSFTPPGDAPSTSPADRRPTDKRPGEAPALQKIPMH